jgi:hypothetical protein
MITLKHATTIAGLLPVIAKECDGHAAQLLVSGLKVFPFRLLVFLNFLLHRRFPALSIVLVSLDTRTRLTGRNAPGD